MPRTAVHPGWQRVLRSKLALGNQAIHRAGNHGSLSLDPVQTVLITRTDLCTPRQVQSRSTSASHLLGSPIAPCSLRRQQREKIASQHDGRYSSALKQSERDTERARESAVAQAGQSDTRVIGSVLIPHLAPLPLPQKGVLSRLLWGLCACGRSPLQAQPRRGRT